MRAAGTIRPAPAEREDASRSGAAWTPEEDELLREYQAKYGNKWSAVAQHIPGRNGQQCAQRWRHKVNPNILRDKWAPDEDEVLIAKVYELGHHWADIARFLPGRTDQQCMGRWRRHLDPAIRKDAWDAAEDDQLLTLYAKYGNSWSCISKCLANRTPQQCRGRWCILSGQGKAKQMMASGAIASAAPAPETPFPVKALPSARKPKPTPSGVTAIVDALQPPTVQQPRRSSRPKASRTPAAAPTPVVMSVGCGADAFLGEAQLIAALGDSSIAEAVPTSAGHSVPACVHGRRTVVFRAQAWAVGRQLTGLQPSPPAGPRQHADDGADQDTDSGTASDDDEADDVGAPEDQGPLSARDELERTSIPNTPSSSDRSRSDAEAAGATLLAMSADCPRTSWHASHKTGAPSTSFPQEHETAGCHSPRCELPAVGGTGLTPPMTRTRARCTAKGLFSTADKRVISQDPDNAPVTRMLQNITSPMPLQVSGHGQDGSCALLLTGDSGDGDSLRAPGLSPSEGQDQHPQWQEFRSPSAPNSIMTLLGGGFCGAKDLVSTPGKGDPQEPTLLQAPGAAGPGIAAVDGLGLPLVSPGATEWSDVPAVSWSDWKGCGEGFGVATKPPAAGTPDNLGATARFQQAFGMGGPSLTPRRDMFVRPGLPKLAAMGSPGFGLAAAGDGDGFGGSNSAAPSPRSAPRPPGASRLGSRVGSRRSSADSAAWDTGDASTDPSMFGTSPTLYKPFAGVMPNDYCSPSKKQKMGQSMFTSDAPSPAAACMRNLGPRSSSLPYSTSLGKTSFGLLDNLPRHVRAPSADNQTRESGEALTTRLAQAGLNHTLTGPTLPSAPPLNTSLPAVLASAVLSPALARTLMPPPPTRPPKQPAALPSMQPPLFLERVPIPAPASAAPTHTHDAPMRPATLPASDGDVSMSEATSQGQGLRERGTGACGAFAPRPFLPMKGPLPQLNISSLFPALGQAGKENLLARLQGHGPPASVSNSVTSTPISKH